MCVSSVYKRPLKPANNPWVYSIYTKGSNAGLKVQILDTTARRLGLGIRARFIFEIFFAFVSSNFRPSNDAKIVEKSFK